MSLMSRYLSIVLLSTATAVGAATYDDYVLGLTSALPESLGFKDFSANDLNTIKQIVSIDTANVPITFAHFSSSDSYYALYSNLQIRAFNLTTKQLLGSWPLQRTADDSLPEARALSLIEVSADDTDYRFHSGRHAPALGCLWDHPLRYGDLDIDGQSELVVLPGINNLGDVDRTLDIAIFSPQRGAVIFSARLAREDIGETFESAGGVLKTRANAGDFPQLGSATDSRSAGNGAVSAYAKLFFGDFDNDNVLDIIAWRKRYLSRLVKDPVQGFVMDKELLTHYKLDSGEYKKQPTDPAVIKGWLASKNLTWKKGYPNNSECAGQTNQLIPEFHDPLLNDPDVL